MSVKLRNQLREVAKKTDLGPGKKATDTAVFNFDIPAYNAGFQVKQWNNGGSTGEGKADDEKGGFEEVSYKKLLKMIETSYPVCPHSKETFDIRERLTVKDYYAKLFDFCRVYKVKQIANKEIKSFQKKVIQ